MPSNKPPIETKVSRNYPPLPAPLSKDTDTTELIWQLTDAVNQIVAYLQALEHDI